ncbi:PREDICTED: uncharacterized protein C20orf85 homolog [Condylura cristata]|uniref:uncharacterized protein C20orf85 homolog n=1 Tax=Condylura cristata TaxID=143302 RepID=UPI000642FCC5|nr:PREDICTED: uncharacterized protein C20orf85 homolog [Condylura cristata]
MAGLIRGSMSAEPERGTLLLPGEVVAAAGALPAPTPSPTAPRLLQELPSDLRSAAATVGAPALVGRGQSRSQRRPRAPAGSPDALLLRPSPPWLIRNNKALGLCENGAEKPDDQLAAAQPAPTQQPPPLPAARTLQPGGASPGGIPGSREAQPPLDGGPGRRQTLSIAPARQLSLVIDEQPFVDAPNAGFPGPRLTEETCSQPPLPGRSQGSFRGSLGARCGLPARPVLGTSPPPASLLGSLFTSTHPFLKSSFTLNENPTSTEGALAASLRSRQHPTVLSAASSRLTCLRSAADAGHGLPAAAVPSRRKASWGSGRRPPSSGPSTAGSSGSMETPPPPKRCPRPVPPRPLAHADADRVPGCWALTLQREANTASEPRALTVGTLAGADRARLPLGATVLYPLRASAQPHALFTATPNEISHHPKISPRVAPALPPQPPSKRRRPLAFAIFVGLRQKYRLKAENEARQNWAQNWGFLTTPLEELVKSQEEPSAAKPRIQLPQRFHIRPVTPVEKYIKVLPSPPIPKTTQGFIGWRSGVPGLNQSLERRDEVRSCKGAYARELNWPKQGIY